MFGKRISLSKKTVKLIIFHCGSIRCGSTCMINNCITAQVCIISNHLNAERAKKNTLGEPQRQTI